MKTLIKKAQHKDADAFVELMQENMKDMYKVARAILSNDEDAADAIQDSIMDMQAGCECDGYENTEWKEMLGCVDEKYRVIIILYYVEGFKIREIGEILHESESAVKRRLASARKQMELAYYPEKRRNAE